MPSVINRQKGAGGARVRCATRSRRGFAPPPAPTALCPGRAFCRGRDLPERPSHRGTRAAVVFGKDSAAGKRGVRRRAKLCASGADVPISCRTGNITPHFTRLCTQRKPRFQPPSATPSSTSCSLTCSRNPASRHPAVSYPACLSRVSSRCYGVGSRLSAAWIRSSSSCGSDRRSGGSKPRVSRNVSTRRGPPATRARGTNIRPTPIAPPSGAERSIVG